MTLSVRLSGGVRISASPGLEAVTALDKDAQCRQLLGQKTTHSAIQNHLLSTNTSHNVFAFFFFFSALPCQACSIFTSPPGLEPGCLAVEALSPSRWSARETPLSVFYTEDWGAQFVFPA